MIPERLQELISRGETMDVQKCTAPKIIQIYPKDSHLDAAFAANLKTLEYG
jgi:hypothetical protein